MSPRPAEATTLHTRLLQCTLESDEAWAYWVKTTPGQPASALRAFEDTWFGAKSLPRVRALLTNFRARYDAFPSALRVLHRWRPTEPDLRAVLGHWHLQLSDPLYRDFTSEFLPQRRARLRPEVARDVVVAWVAAQSLGRWTARTQLQFATKLLSSAHAAGLVLTKRDPRPLGFPVVSDLALTYLLYLLREVRFQGTLLDNPYLRSVGLEPGLLAPRLRHLNGLRFGQQGDLVDLEWSHPDLEAWAGSAGLTSPPEASA